MLKKNFFNFKLNNLNFFNQILLLRSKLLFFKIQRKNLKIFKYFDDRRIGSIPRILIASIFVVFSFYWLPLISSYTKNNFMITNEFQNNSKSILAYTLNKKNEGANDDNELNEKDLLIDIFSLNDLETDTVRLNASTIKQF